jgi:N-acetylglucosamine-6-phosphate deacetylase
MSDAAVFCPRLFDGWRMHERTRLLVRDGRTRALQVGAAPQAGDFVLPAGTLAAPGLVDIQVNGGGGRLFNDDPTVWTIAVIAQAHCAQGTTALLPTLITDTREVIDRAVAAAREACERVRGVLGIHLEGPFLHPERRGIHREALIAEFGAAVGGAAADIDRLTALGAAGRTIVTLAPERVPASTITALRERGAIVFGGHTTATFAQAQAALAEGLQGFTHLFNAMTQLGAREPGVVGAALLHPEAWVGLVLDGHHVAPGTVAVLRAVRGWSRVVLVSDAMPPAGTAQTRFVLQGQPIRVEADGRCVDGAGTLSGASITLADAVRQAIALYGAAPHEALASASRLPAELLGRSDLGVLAPGSFADMVVFDDAWRVLGVMQRGQWVRPPPAVHDSAA